MAKLTEVYTLVFWLFTELLVLVCTRSYILGFESLDLDNHLKDMGIFVGHMSYVNAHREDTYNVVGADQRPRADDMPYCDAFGCTSNSRKKITGYHSTEWLNRPPNIVIRESSMFGSTEALLCFSLLADITSTTWGQAVFPYTDVNAGTLRLFYKVNDVKSVFRSPEYSTLPACRTVMEVFEQDCCPFEKQYIRRGLTTSKYPFIVFEGNHRISTAILSKRLAKTMTASHFSMCPPCLIPYRKLFTPRDLLLRRAFFGLGVYVLSYQATEALTRWPVVVTSYWNHQAVFALTKLLNETDVPKPDSPLYSLWPEDVMKPDILFYINFPDNMHFQPITTRQPSSWKPRLLEFYKRIKTPIIVEINTKYGWDQAIKEIQGSITKHLNSTKEFTFQEVFFRSYGKKQNQTWATLT